MNALNKNVILAIAITAAASSGVANALEENVNYGDPTASFTMAGASVQDNGYQLNGMYGADSDIFQADLGATTRGSGKDTNFRGRYFHVTEGLGYSVDLIGSMGESGNKTDSTALLAGAIYKIPVSNNVMVFPMLSAGYLATDTQSGNRTIESDSALAQAGLYAMYAFDAGHWMYANPKVTHAFNGGTNTVQLEMGGGYMLTEASSVGFKLDHTYATSRQPENTVGWIQGSLYF